MFGPVTKTARNIKCKTNTKQQKQQHQQKQQEQISRRIIQLPLNRWLKFAAFLNGITSRKV
jgi:hypothetical protein